MPLPRRLDPVPDPVLKRSHRVHRTHSHGGAWKVAYADFVTALMCLFIVLWLTGSTQMVKKSITGYFRDPKGYTEKLGAGPANSGEGLRVTPKTVKDFQQLLDQAIRQMPEFQTIRDNVKTAVTGEGLRIELMENAQGSFFVSGSGNPSSAGENLLRVLATEIAKLPNRLAIEGHSDAYPFRNSAPASGYSNWELSTDRANAARRLLHAFGVPAGQVAEVRGYADQALMDEANPNNPRNRRVSLVVKFQ